MVFSDKQSNLPALATISPDKANATTEGGELNWQFIRNLWIGKHFLWQFGIVRLAFSRRFDVIIYLGNMYFLSTWLSVIIANLMGKRTLMWTHGYLRDERGLKGWLRERFYRLSDGLLLYGNHAKNILMRRGFKAQDLYVISNSLDFETQCTVRETIDEQTRAQWKRQLFPSHDWPVIVSVGRLIPRKQLDLLIKATALLKGSGLDVNVLFIGDGPSRGELESLVTQYGIGDRVTFYGECYDEGELGPMINMADVCVIPGWMGLTAMHAMVYGTPVITHDDPDHHPPEHEAVVPDRTGALFKRGSAQDLADTLRRWLTQDKERGHIRVACQEIIAKYFTPSFQREMIEEAVRGVAAKKVVFTQ